MPSIRIVETTDFELVASLLAESPALVHPPSPEKLKREHKRGAHFFLAYYDDQVCGTICAKKVTFFASEIKYLYVKPECRGRGIGKALVKYATDYADNELNTPVKMAVTHIDNYIVQHINEYFGYRPVGTFKSPLSNNILVLYIKINDIVEVNEENLAEWEM